MDPVGSGSVESDEEARRISRGDLLKYGAGALAASGTLAGVAARATSAAASARAVPKHGGTIKAAFSDAASSDSLDPALPFTFCSIGAGGMIYDTLIRCEDNWATKPMLAESWTVNPTATRYTFKLRKGVQFHSGKTLTARDVQYTITRLLNPKTGSGALGWLASVLRPSSIKVIDPYTIQFNLLRPDPFFLVKMGHYYTRIAQEGTTNFSKGSHGTGPFKSLHFTGGQGFQFVKNPHYWQSGRPYLDGINGVVLVDLATKAESVLRGDTDITDLAPFSYIPQFKADKNLAVLNGPGPAYDFGINGTVKPYTDVRVRRALKYMLDRKKMVDVVCFGQATVSADSIVNPVDPYYPKDLKPFPYDPEKAKSLLKAAGYGNGWKETIWTSGCCVALVEGGLYLQQIWKQNGINASVANVSGDQFFSKVFGVQPVVANYWLRQHPVFQLPFNYASKGANNESRINDPKINAWTREALTTTKVPLQKELIGEVLKRYNDIASTIFPFHFYKYLPHKKNLNGAKEHWVDQIDFRGAWLS